MKPMSFLKTHKYIENVLLLLKKKKNILFCFPRKVGQTALHDYIKQEKNKK